VGEGRRFAGFTVWLVRTAALVIAAALLRWSGQLEEGFRAETAAEFGPDWAQWWLIRSVYVVAGMAFTVAVRFPFPRSRFAWSRLGIAALAILPAVHFWYGWAVTAGPAFLRRSYWFDFVTMAVWPILAGVAIGAGFGARRSAEDPADERAGG
jgi:hypothetical protein